MEVNTTRFGKLEYTEEEIVTLTSPLLGFQQYRRFLLLPAGQDATLFWLQSVDAGELAFLLMDPRAVATDYQAPIAAGDLRDLGADSPGEVSVFTTVAVPGDGKVRTNLRAPLLYHPQRKLAKQVVLENTDYPIQYYIATAQSRKEAQDGASHAYTDSQT